MDVNQHFAIEILVAQGFLGGEGYKNKSVCLYIVSELQPNFTTTRIIK